MNFRHKMKVLSSVGVQISPTAIRAVEVRIQGRETVVQHLAQLETPSGSAGEAWLVNPTALAGALRRLWEIGSFTTRRCTVAVSAGTLTPQMLTVPPAPADEQRLIIRGELARFAPENASSPFGWMLMACGGGPGGNALAFLAEPAVLAGCEEAFALAGLEIEACEPDAAAALRAVMFGTRPPASGSTAGAAVLYLDEECSDIAFLEAGRVRYYRRFDRGLVGAAEAVDPLASADEEELSALTLEIKRSLQYYARAYANAAQPQRVLLLGAVERPGSSLETLAAKIREKLRLDADCFSVFGHYPHGPASGADAAASGGEYAVALGLALRPLSDPHTGSALNLRARDEALALARRAPRYLMAAFTGSTLLALAALAASLSLGLQLNQVHSQLSAADAELLVANAQHAASLMQMQQARTAADQLRRQALPVPQLLTRLGEMVPARLALTELQLNEDGSLALEGDAETPMQVNRLLRELSDDARFRSPNLDALEDRTQQGATHFKVQTGLVGCGKSGKREGA